MILNTTVDAYVDQDTPGTNFGSVAKLKLRGGSTHQKRIFVHFTRPFPLTATVLSATMRIYLSGAWASSNTVTAKRITQKWAESTIKWNAKPNVSATHDVAVSVSSGLNKQVVEFDIKDMLQDVADGAAWFGVELTLSTDAVRYVRSSEDSDVTLRPELELEWTDAPDPPDRLVPDGADAVSDAFPRVAWRYNDKIAGHKQQTYSQVQIASTAAGFDDVTGFPSPDYDSGQVANDQNDFVIDGTGGYLGLTADADAFWIVKVWDNAGLDSDWSQPAEMVYKTLGSFAIDAPGSTVPETTPPFTWTLTGRTQLRYRVILYEVPATGKPLRLWAASATTSENSVTPPAKLITEGKNYRVTYEVWDTIVRTDNGHIGDADHPEAQDFTYVLDGTPDPVDTFTAVPGTNGSPAVECDFTRSVEPDYFALLVDGVLVEDRIDPDDVVVSPGVYQFIYWGASPRDSHDYAMQAVVQSGGGGTPYLHSASSPTVTLTTQPWGIWLVDEADNKAVQIVGDETFDATIGESATTYDPVGARIPVRITDAIRGYEGTISGVILGLSDRNDYLTLKGRQTTLRLIVGDVTVPVRLEATAVNPTASPGDIEQQVSFTFFQVGAPWPTKNVS